MTVLLFSDKLKGKVIWITGASSGIGEHLAVRLASVGAKLVLSGKQKGELEFIARKCSGREYPR